MKSPIPNNWTNISNTPVMTLRCGHCGRDVASVLGWTNPQARIEICPLCNRPNYFEGTEQIPGPRPGGLVEHLPPEVENLYEEARNVMAANAPTSATLALRKLLMHVAVQKRAPAGQTFQQYVSYFQSEHLVPSGAKDWVDHIRNKGNEATHEIAMINKADAEELLVFSEMLLKLVYEFPNRLTKTK